MSKDCFNYLLEQIGGQLENPHPKMTRGSDPVTPPLMLSITLRILAGGSYLDVADLHGIHENTVWKYFWRCVTAIVNKFSIDYPVDNIEELRRIEKGFRAVSTSQVMKGCVGAIDGLVYKMKAPKWSDTKQVQRYRSRKGYYGANVQAICDSYRRFLFFDISAPGSSNDKHAFGFTKLRKQLERRELPSQFWIAGDNAYHEYVRTTGGSIVTPLNHADLSEDEKNFNHYFRQLRIISECAFGILIARFGILWKPLSFGTVRRCNTIVLCCAKLHNVIINHKLNKGKGNMDAHERSIKEITEEMDSLIPELLSSAVTEGVYEGRKNTASCVYFNNPKYDRSRRSPVGMLNDRWNFPARKNRDYNGGGVIDKLVNEVRTSGIVRPAGSCDY